MKKTFSPPSTSPVDDRDTPQPHKQTPKRPIIPQLRINQDTKLGSRSSSDSSSSLHHNEHMAKTRHEEVEDLLPQKSILKNTSSFLVLTTLSCAVLLCVDSVVIFLLGGCEDSRFQIPDSRFQIPPYCF